jgi:hypothetical protein
MSLVDHVEALQGDVPWGRFLDAGTGVNSSLWSTGLVTEAWTGVTAAPGHAEQVRTTVGERLRPQDRLLLGNWTDPTLLADEVHDTVLADYLIGAVEGFAPYFQQSLLRRLRSVTGRRLYVVGLDPYVVGPAETDEARMVREIGRLRDAVLMLADETPYREYPAEWTLNALAGASGCCQRGAFPIATRRNGSMGSWIWRCGGCRRSLTDVWRTPWLERLSMFAREP